MKGAILTLMLITLSISQFSGDEFGYSSEGKERYEKFSNFCLPDNCYEILSI